MGASSTTTFTYNTTAPSVAIAYPVNNTTYGANWTGAITGTSTANASGSTISTVKVSIQQGSGNCWTGYGQHLHGGVPELRGGHKRNHQLVAHDPGL